MKERPLRRYVGISIAALMASVAGQAVGSVSVEDGLRLPAFGQAVRWDGLSAPSGPNAALAGDPDLTLSVSDWDHQRIPWDATLLGASPERATARPESGHFLQPDSRADPLPISNPKTWNQDAGYQDDGDHDTVASQRTTSIEHLHSNRHISADDIALQIESLAVDNAMGVGAVMPPSGVGRTSGEGDPGHTAFKVMGDTEPSSSLPVIPAPVAILLAGLSAVLIGWSRYRRAM